MCFGGQGALPVERNRAVCESSELSCVRWAGGVCGSALTERRGLSSGLVASNTTHRPP